MKKGSHRHGIMQLAGEHCLEQARHVFRKQIKHCARFTITWHQDTAPTDYIMIMMHSINKYEIDWIEDT